MNREVFKFNNALIFNLPNLSRYTSKVLFSTASNSTLSTISLISFSSGCICKEMVANKIYMTLDESDYEPKIVLAKREEISGGFKNYKLKLASFSTCTKIIA